MSSTLECKPVVPQESNVLDDQLKFILRKHNLPKIYNSSDLCYLNGLLEAGIKGARSLIEAIEKHAQVEVFESY